MKMKSLGLGLALWLATLVPSCGEDGSDDGTAPADVNAEPVSGRAIHVTWTDNLADEMGYEVERKDSGAYTVIAILPFNSNTHHDDDAKLVPGTKYTFRVRAKLKDGQYGSYSKVATSIPGS